MLGAVELIAASLFAFSVHVSHCDEAQLCCNIITDVRCISLPVLSYWWRISEISEDAASEPLVTLCISSCEVSFASFFTRFEPFRCAAVLTCADGDVILLSSQVEAQYRDFLPPINVTCYVQVPSRGDVKPF